MCSLRLQAREEAQKAFGNTALGEGSKKKYPKVTIAKQSVRRSPRLSEGRERYKTRVQSSREKAIDSFGGSSLDELSLKKKPKL